MIRNLFNHISRSINTDQPIPSQEPEIVFKECPKLALKRQQAIEYLGDKWLLASKQQRLAEPRRV